jgi:F420-non-reducing hydrogenase large subunit
MRHLGAQIIEGFAGRAIHPTFAVPGGVSRPLGTAGLERLAKLAASSLGFAREAQEILSRALFDDPTWRETFSGKAFTAPSYSLGLTGSDDAASWLGDSIKVVDSKGNTFARFAPARHAEHLARAAEPWTRRPFAYLKAIGWHGLAEPAGDGIYAVGPLARLNMGWCGGSATPLANAERERLIAALGPGPHHSMAAAYWAGLVELLYAAERLVGLGEDETILDSKVRQLPDRVAGEGVGAVEGPAGLVLHHYWTDDRGIAVRVYVLDTATSNNAIRNLAVRRAAAVLLSNGLPSREALRFVQLALTPY